MAYIATISNEQTAELPSASFDGEIIVIDKEEQLVQACRDLSSQSIIGFDTETRPSFKAGVTNRVALLQLSTSERCYLIRLCRMRLHKDILRILSNQNILKIGADVAGDIRALHTLRNFTERGFVDLQHIASDWGIEEKSLRKLSAIVLDKRVSKAQRLSNWEASVLTPQQRMYAATDAWVCIKIYEKLMSSPRVKPSKEEPKPENQSASAVSSEVATIAAGKTTKRKRPYKPKAKVEPAQDGQQVDNQPIKEKSTLKRSWVSRKKKYGGKRPLISSENNEK
jgi:ribonuclease D